MDFNDRRFDPAPHVAAIKKSQTALLRLGNSDNGTSKATFNAQMRHHSTINAASNALADNGYKDTVGQLVDAHQTKQRLREAKAKEQYRPELERRLAQAKLPRAPRLAR